MHVNNHSALNLSQLLAKLGNMVTGLADKFNNCSSGHDVAGGTTVVSLNDALAEIHGKTSTMRWRFDRQQLSKRCGDGSQL